MICVRTYLSRVDAEGARIALEGDGIRAHIQADDAGGMRPELSMIFGSKVFVKEEDAERAKEILDACDKPIENKDEHEPAQRSDGFLTKLRQWLKG